ARGELFVADAGNQTIRKAAVAADPPRLTNCSVLTTLADANDSVMLGAIMSGAGTTGASSLLVRAAGRSLRAFGVARPLDDARLELFNGPTQVGENDDWGGSRELSAVFSR